MAAKYPSVKPVLPPGVKLEENVYVAMRDGVRIAVDIYRPDKAGRYLLLPDSKRGALAGLNHIGWIFPGLNLSFSSSLNSLVLLAFI